MRIFFFFLRGGATRAVRARQLSAAGPGAARRRPARRGCEFSDQIAASPFRTRVADDWHGAEFMESTLGKGAPRPTNHSKPVCDHCRPVLLGVDGEIACIGWARVSPFFIWLGHSFGCSPACSAVLLLRQRAPQRARARERRARPPRAAMLAAAARGALRRAASAAAGPRVARMCTSAAARRPRGARAQRHGRVSVRTLSGAPVRRPLSLVLTRARRRWPHAPPHVVPLNLASSVSQMLPPLIPPKSPPRPRSMRSWPSRGRTECTRRCTTRCARGCGAGPRRGCRAPPGHSRSPACD